MKNTRMPPVKVASRSRSSWMRGWAVRRSQTMKSASRTAPPPSSDKVAGAPQPHSAPCMRPITRALSPATSEIRPGPSILPAPLRSAGGAVQADQTTAAITVTTGRLIQKIQRQDRVSVKRPPNKGPMDMKRPPTVTWMPKAVPRCSAGKMLVIMAQEAGNTTAAPIPWRPRAAISQAPLWAKPAASDASPKTATPATKKPRCPSTSPSRPPTATKQVKVKR